MIFNFLRLLLTISLHFVKQYVYFHTYIRPLLLKSLKKTDDSFSMAYFKRMRIYACYAPVVFGIKYATLFNHKMTRKERRTMTALAAATPIFDDYFDNPNLDEALLYDIINSPETFKPNNTLEEIFKALLLNVKPNIPDFDFFMHNCFLLFKVQKDSAKQINGTFNEEELKEVTFNKGGYSTLLFFGVINRKNSENDLQLIYQFGAILQLFDDIFDLFEDDRAHIQTLPTATKDINELTILYKKELYVLLDYLKASPLPQKSKRKFLNYQLFFFAEAYVCLNQFLELQVNDGGVFNPKNYTRKQLIGDMEKWQNIVFWYKKYAYWKRRLRNEV